LIQNGLDSHQSAEYPALIKERQTTPMKMNKKIIPLALIVMLAVFGFYYWWHGREADRDTGHITLYGNVDIREVQLAFNESEHIDAILVQEGDKVTQGQIVARLDRARLQASRDEAQAVVAAQEQTLARLEAGSRPEEIAKARADLAAAAAQAQAARDTYTRQQSLLTKKLTSPETVDLAKASADSAAAQAKAVQATLDLALAGPRREDIAQARAELQARRAALALADEHLADTVLYAPAEGVVRDRILEPGDMATPQTPVLTLALLNPVWVRAWLAEPDLGKIAPGMKAEIRSDSYPEKVYKGWVGYISPTAEFTPKNVESPELRTRLVYQLRVYACNPADALRLGMPVTVTIPLDQPTAGATPNADRCGDG
jgi:HlyD family secretion protein